MTFKSTPLLALALFASAAIAQTYPSKPITLVVPFTAGAANDTMARTLAAELRDSLGTVVVENKPGAGGSIAADYVKRAPADGYTLLVVNDSYLILQAMNKTLSYDIVKDFAPVSRTADLPFYLVVNSDAMPVKTLKEFIDYVRVHPGKISYATPGIGTPHHLSAEWLKQVANLDATHVAYRGMAIALPDLLAGRVQFTITGLPAVASHLNSGKLRILATLTGTRSPSMPDVPTFAEAGVPGVSLDQLLGIMAPAGTPGPVIERLNAEINRALKTKDLRNKLVVQGMEPGGGTSEEMAERMRAGHQTYKEIIARTGIRTD
jgi:tripartite-type tricarboxylate transporter receptor subunit TctC